MDFFNIIISQSKALLFIGLSSAFSILLGFFVYFHDTRNKINITFLFMSLIASIWSWFNFFVFNAPTANIFIWILRLLIISALWFGFSFYLLFSNLTGFFNKKIFQVNLIFTIILSVIILTPVVFKGVKSFSIGGNLNVETGFGIIIFGIFNTYLHFYGLFLLIKKLLQTPLSLRLPYYLMIIGFSISLVLVILFNFIFPNFFSNNKYVIYGAAFLLPFLIATSVTILGYKIINVRVITAALFTFILIIINLYEFVSVRTYFDLIIRLMIFIGIIAFGVLLIRSVLGEVKRREELAELNKRLQLAYEEVDRLSKAKSEFISIVSHQLRAPLTAIKGYVSLMIDGTYGKVDEKILKPLKNVYISCERLIRLINDLLNISRVEAGKMEFNPQEERLEEIVESVVEELKVNAKKKNLYLEWKKPLVSLPLIYLDREKIRDVLINLIDNSIKYTKSGGVSVELGIFGNNVRIFVKDTGEGMDENDLEKIFDIFSRGSTGKKIDTEGAGLGLYIVKKFVEMHKGKVWAESGGKGKGSTFIVELPIAR
jgi:signal transduction histidine kinase